MQMGSAMYGQGGPDGAAPGGGAPGPEGAADAQPGAKKKKDDGDDNVVDAEFKDA